MEMNPLVLIVDDQPDNLYMYARYFESNASLRVVTAANGAEAILKAKRFQPDLILLDIAMPEMDGYEVAGVLQADPATERIPIVLLSAYASEAEATARLGPRFKAFVSEVARGYVAKPCLPDVLLQQVKSALADSARR